MSLEITTQIAVGHNLGDAVLDAAVFDRGLAGFPSRQLVVFFRNGYGASVIQGPYSYGGREGLYELAILTDCEYLDGGYNVGLFGDDDTRVPIPNLADDGIAGYLDPEALSKLLREISELPS